MTATSISPQEACRKAEVLSGAVLGHSIGKILVTDSGQSRMGPRVEIADVGDMNIAICARRSIKIAEVVGRRDIS